MYTVREVPSKLSTDARGLSLREAFTRIMALTERQYQFARTGRRMHLIMIGTVPGEPVFESEFAIDGQARDAIMAQVCAHGFGRFQVITDEQYRLERLRNEQAA